MNNKSSLSKLLPVLFAFFIMGFVDVVGIATNYVKKDFSLSDTLANLLPMMVFLWFLVVSVPTGLIMNRTGRKNAVLISNLLTILAMVIPLISYQFPVLLIAFALLGIGNTIIQVALNPLLTNVVSGKRLTSSLTLGQFIKAIASFLGPVIASLSAKLFNNWKYIFLTFALMTVLSTLWLMLAHIDEEKTDLKTSSFTECFGLLKDKAILLFFLGIISAVGIDVGLNTTIPKFITERTGLLLEEAGYGTSLYFAARTLGTFVGALVLVRISGKRFFTVNMIIAVAAMVCLLFMSNIWTIWILIFILGFTIANVFPIIFAAAMQRRPAHYNEISGLLIMGVSGGAFITFIVGVISDLSGTQAGGLTVLLVVLLYLLVTALSMKK
ncbi:MAG: MFS transporter [Bacteroidales bacterium]|nr:MFS transporter [Bacteroidales bacterium]MBN2762243.1 MFS transporter [Bacteroidales bacterium]